MKNSSDLGDSLTDRLEGDEMFKVTRLDVAKYNLKKLLNNIEDGRAMVENGVYGRENYLSYIQDGVKYDMNKITKFLDPSRIDEEVCRIQFYGEGEKAPTGFDKDEADAIKMYCENYPLVHKLQPQFQL